MSLIHYRLRDGKPVYRLWSSNSDSYLTYDLTREELITELRMEAIREALRSVDIGFERRTERVHRMGTSDALLREPLPLDGPWTEELNHEEDDDDDEEAE